MSNTIDYNSIANQQIKGRFVHREVFGCQTPEVEYILSRWDYNDAPYTYDDVENLYLPYCGDCGEHATDFEETEDDDGDTLYRCTECGREYSEDAYKHLDTTPQEIYEWYAISGFLAAELKAYGECILDGPICCYWGRCCTGQAVLLDWVISKICEKMEILDGQRYSWASMAA